VSKPFGVIVTIPKPKAVVMRCLHFDKWTFEIPFCHFRDADSCAGCQYAEKVVGKIEDIFPEDKP